MVNQIVTFRVKPEYLDMFKAALIEDRKNAQQEQGCIEMRLFSNRQTQGLIFCYERWKDPDALDYHREHPYSVKICSLVDTGLAAPMEVLDLGDSYPDSEDDDTDLME